MACVEMQKGRFLTVPELVSAGQGHHALPTLDRWMVRHMVQTVQGYIPRTLPRSEFVISLNVTAHSATDVDFVDFLGRELAGSDLLERMLIEIPEEAAVRIAHSGTHLLRSLRNSGCRLCIDGVGPDPKRLAALQQLPVGLVKVGAQLVRSIPTHPQAETVVRSIVEFARAAGITIAAKGVETIAVAEYLRKLGFELGQGHAFGPAESFASILARLDRL